LTVEEAVPRTQKHTQCVYSAAWLDHQCTLCTASFDGTVLVWDVRAHSRGGVVGERSPPMEGTKAYAAVGSNTTGTLLTAHGDGSVRVCDMRMWGAVAVLRGHMRWVERLALSPQVLMSASVDGTGAAFSQSSPSILVASFTRG
jgi:WD40 repeat protein